MGVIARQNRWVSWIAGLGLIMAALVLPLRAQAAIHPATPSHSTVTPRSVLAHAASLPLAFEPNRGQTDSRVRFLAHAGGSTIFLTERGIVLVSARPTTPLSHLTPSLGSLTRSITPARGREAVLQMLPIGASTHARIVGSARLPGFVNYIIGHTSHTNIPTYAAVRYENIYPGIDLALHGAQSGFEYDWILKPGADASKIALRMQGATNLALGANGSLLMRTAVGTMVQQQPVLYQLHGRVRQRVAGAFRLDGSTVRLWVGGYDHRLPLIIDPTQTLLYSTYLGGSIFDQALGIAVDTSGNAYVTGGTASTDFPICPDNGGSALYCASHTGSPAQATFGGNDDAFVAKLNPAGTQLLYSTYLGGSGVEEAAGIAVDTAGDAFVTGITFSTDFPICPDNGGSALYCASHTGSPAQATYGGNEDAFVAKLNPAGTQLLYSTYLGGSTGDVGTGIAIDTAGDAYVTGFTFSTDFPICPDNGGTHTYCASHTGSPVQSTFGGIEDAFVAKLNPAGTQLLYSTYLGGSGVEEAAGIAVDTAGDAFVTGLTESTDFPICPDNGGTHTYCASHTGSPVQATFGGTADAFVAKLNPAGTQLLYSTYLGGSSFDLGAGIAVDTSGNAYVTGGTASTDFPICPDNGGSALYCASHTGSPAQATFGGNDDAFVAKLNPAGTQLLYSTYLGGSSGEEGLSVAVDTAGDAYVTGLTESTDFPICPDNGGTHTYCASHTGSPVQATFGGTADAFVAKLNPAGTQLLYSTYLGGSSFDLGAGIAVDTSGDAFVTGYTQSTDFPICPDNGGAHTYCASHTGSPVQATFGGVEDAFVTKLSPGVITVTGQTIHCQAGVSCTQTVATITDTDGDPCTNYTAQITWGDGSSTTAGTVSGTNATLGCSVSGTHTYLFPGNYTTTISVQDSDGTSGTGQGAAVVGFAPSTPGTTIAAANSRISCAASTNLIIAMAIHVGSPGGIFSTVSFQDFATGTLIRSAAGFRVMSVVRTGSGRFNGSGNTAVVYGSQGSGVGIVYVRMDLADLAFGGCGDTFRLRTSTGYDSGTKPVAQVSITTP